MAWTLPDVWEGRTALNEAHELSKAAIRQLLVMLERLPPHLAWILTTTNDGQESLFKVQIDAHPLLSQLRGAALHAAFPHRKQTCSRCGKPCLLGEFGVAPGTTDGLYTVCNGCRNAQERARTAKRPCQCTSARLQRLADPSAPWKRLEAFARTIERTVCGHGAAGSSG